MSDLVLDIYDTRRCPHGKPFDYYCEPCEKAEQEEEQAAMSDPSQYRCQPEKQVYCPHMDQAHALLAEWLKAWDSGKSNAQLYERTRALLQNAKQL